jgi:hypothetical protein
MKNWISKLTKGAVVQAAALLIVPVTCSMAFAACSGLESTARNQPATASRAYLQQTQEKPGDQPVKTVPQPWAGEFSWP